MSPEKIEETRERIWDYLFHNGQKSIQDLEQELELTEPEVLDSITSDWFVVDGQNVLIATGDQ